MKRVVCGTIAALIMVGCSSDVDESTGSLTSNTKLSNQAEELNAYLEMSQSAEEPKQTSDEMSSKGNLSKGMNLALPKGEVLRALGDQLPKVGDTISTEKGVRVIIKTVTNITDLGILVEKDFNNELDGVEPNKTLTGMAWWEGVASYNILTLNPLAYDVSITQISGWGYDGLEHRDWNGRVFEDSLRYAVSYTDPAVSSLKPGNSTLWSKVLLSPKGIGMGDTALITVDSLDDVKHTQYGEGTLYSKGLDRTFSYDFELIHRNEENPDSPYEKYEYNQSVVRFSIPMISDKVDFNTLQAAIYYHVDRDTNGTADLYERDVVLTTENGDTVVTASGNVFTGIWTVKKNEAFFTVK